MTFAIVMALNYEDYYQQIHVIGKYSVLERFQVGLMSTIHLWMKMPHFSKSCPFELLLRFRNPRIPRSEVSSSRV